MPEELRLVLLSTFAVLLPSLIIVEETANNPMYTEAHFADFCCKSNEPFLQIRGVLKKELQRDASISED